MKIDCILCGKSQEILREMDEESVDIIITSPPYNFGMNYDQIDDNLDFEEYYKMLNAVFVECVRVLKKGGRMCVNLMPKWDKNSPTHHIATKMIMDMGLFWFGEILWIKGGIHSTAWGSWASPSSPSFISNGWEFIEVFYKNEKKKAGRKKDIDITPEEFKDWINAKWVIAASNGKAYAHPATFPEEIPKRLMKLLSYKGDLVLDPFNGIGTTTYVANRLGRHFVGIDISEEYCKTARRRLAGEFEKKPTKSHDWEVDERGFIIWTPQIFKEKT